MDNWRSLERFFSAQETDYAVALEEVRRGSKESHWMWYIFPQLRSLGQSNMSWFFGIEDLEEARAYLEHPVLGSRLREITQAALDLPGCNARAIFGSPDHMKLRSCMTLFNLVSEDDLFQKVLDKFYGGQLDPRTMELSKR